MEANTHFLVFDPFIQTLDFNNHNPECLEGTVTPIKEQIILHSTINIFLHAAEELKKGYKY